MARGSIGLYQYQTRGSYPVAPKRPGLRELVSPTKIRTLRGLVRLVGAKDGLVGSVLPFLRAYRPSGDKTIAPGSFRTGILCCREPKLRIHGLDPSILGSRLVPG